MSRHVTPTLGAPVTSTRTPEQLLARREAEARALAELAETALGQRTASALLSAVLTTVGRVVPSRHVLLMASPDGEQLTVSAIHTKAGPAPLQVGDPVVAEVPLDTYRSDQPKVCRDMPLDARPAMRELGRLLRVRSGMAVPVPGSPRPRGVLAVTSEGAGEHDSDDLHFLTTVARITGLALDRLALEARLDHAATHDSLTGLPNRALLTDRLEQAVQHSTRTGELVAVALIDVDAFKLVNDTYGHGAGDLLLVELSSRLRTHVRPADTVARLGGDEFAVVLTTLHDPREALAVASRIHQTWAEPFTLAGTRVRSTASIGLALTGADSDPSGETLLRDADIALYRAKAEGRDRIQVFDASLQAAARARFDLEDSLAAALVGGQFSLAYQPVIDLERGRPVAAEALLRWTHPRRGLIPPDQFIPVAEETEAIVAIGGWVLTEAARQVAAWRREGLRIPVAVNLSAVQLHRPGLVEQVRAELTESGLDPEDLTLEITESVLLRDTREVAATLGRLRDLGVPVLLDDFGTGYSSLAYLHRVPLAGVKLDGSFARRLGQDSAADATLDAVARLAAALGLVTVAEGVETAAQLQRVRELGYDRAQGFHIGRPEPADVVAARWEPLVDPSR